MRNFLLAFATAFATIALVYLGLSLYYEREFQRTVVKEGDILNLRVQRDAPFWESGCGVHFSEFRGVSGAALLRADEFPRSALRVLEVRGNDVIAEVIFRSDEGTEEFACPVGSTLRIDLRTTKIAKVRSVESHKY